MSDYPEFDTAREIEKIVLERDLQKQCVGYMTRRGWWARKLSSPQNNGIMDYSFAKDTWVELEEFKKPGNCKKPYRGLSPTQIEEHKAARAAGMLPIVMDNYGEFRRYMTAVFDLMYAAQLGRGEDILRERKTLAAPYMPAFDK
jgi:hypothetical protein